MQTKNGKIMLISNCAVCDSKKLRFIKELEAKGLLGSKLGKKRYCYIKLVIFQNHTPVVKANQS